MSDSTAEETELNVADEVEYQNDDTDEPLSIPEPGSEEAEEALQEPEEEDGEEKSEESAEEEYEEIEFDFGGKKLTVSKDKTVDAVAGELQDYAKSLEGDYTRKTQSLAEQRKSLDAQTESFTKLSSLNDEAFQTYTQFSAAEAELARYNDLDWPTLWAEDRSRAEELAQAQTQLKHHTEGLQKEFQAKADAMNQEQSQQRGRFLEEGKRVMEGKVKGFESKAADLVDYVVKTYGVPREKAEDWPLNPAGAEMAYKAMLWDKNQQGIKTAKTKVKPANPVPAAKTKGKSMKKALHEMSMSEFVKAREAGRFE